MWALVFALCGEFQDFATAFYHSAVNYTSPGLWRCDNVPYLKLLGPLDTANGMLLFGVSTVMVFAVIQRLVETRSVDLEE